VGADLTGGTPGLHGFPGTLTSFVGRSEAVRELAGLLETSRLVTVLGPGGVGKTRLAGVVACGVAGRFADGVWLVELAAVTDPGRIPAVVAAALRVPPRPGTPDTDVLAAALAQRQVLIVIDNCEHVIQAVAELCLALLPAADDVRMLATSREPVGVPGEIRYRLRPLGLPELDNQVGLSEAEDLFADRARQADPEFVLDERTQPMVARLVRQLDGLPLAVELAAARVDSLGLPQLLDRLDQRLSLLAGTDRLAAARHQSLAATVDWSYQLLSQAEQRVFRQLSVFPGPFTLEGAEAVAGPAAAPAVLRLVDCSLVAPPSAGPDGRSRYLLLDTLRTYGASQLDRSDERPAARAALARHAVGVTDQAAAAMRTSPGEPAAVRWLDAEDAAIQVALDWALGHDPDVAVRLVTALGPWWYIRGQLAAALPVLQAAARYAEPPGDLWCAVQCWIGQAGHTSGNFILARDSVTAVIEAAAGRPPFPWLVDALAGRAGALANMNLIGAGLDDARRAVAVARDLDYRAGEALARTNLGLTAYYAGDMETALAEARRAARIDPAVIPGWIARRASLFLSMFLTETGDRPAAEKSCQDGLVRAREADDLRSETFCLGLLADLDLHAGRIADAGRHLRESLELSTRIGDAIGLLNGLDRAALLCTATQRWAEAVALWSASAARSRDHDLPDVPQDARRREEASGPAREALGPAAFQAAEQRGAAMTLATAAELAAMITVTGTPSGASSRSGAGTPGGSGSLIGGGSLSPRERELVALIARGRTDAQIAEELFISVRTVRSHLDRIRDKTGSRRRADLTRLALEEGLV
jgi:predicted ATPase/DNA-binding CsgD family transcriptional regulator